MPFFTFSARLDEKEAEFVAARIAYSISGDLHSGGQLIDPVTKDADYVTRLHQLRFISDATADQALEQHLSAPDAKVAFFWEIDYRSPDGGETSTTRSALYETDTDDIVSANLAREIQ